jgi:hypothetical protein
MRLTRRGRLVVSVFVTLVAMLLAWYAAAGHGSSSSASQLTVAPVPTPTLSLAPTPSPSASPSPRRVLVRRTVRPTPSPQPSHTASRSPKPTVHGTGDLVVVPGVGELVGHGPTRRYTVEVESGLGVSGASFAAAVAHTLGQDEDWGADYSFKRVSSGPVSFTVTLASPAETDALCRPQNTGGWLSCFNGSRAVINADRWKYGAKTYGSDLAGYRIYVVSHEVGHALGHGHQYSCLSGGLAPVMMQQTKSLYGCTRNPWPHPSD